MNNTFSAETSLLNRCNADKRLADQVRLRRRTNPVLIAWRGTVLAALCTAAISTSAYACPPGTVFSAYEGHGICAFVGQGAKAQSTCVVAYGTCPAGTDRNHSGNDPTRDYCCPEGGRRITGNQTECNVKCLPLLKSTQPKTEANRVFANCMVLCTQPVNGTIICPNLTTVKVGQACK